MRMNYITEIPRMLPYAALMARKGHDLDGNAIDGNDYIEDMLRKMHGDRFISFARVKCGVDFSGVIELDNQIIIAHLGTEGGLFGKAWLSNIFGAFRTMRGIHSGFYDAGKATFNAVQYHTFAYSRTDKPVIQVTHSRGVRGKIAAQRAAYQLEKIVPTYCFCPPPCFTKDGQMIYDSLGIPTVNIFNPNDPVDKLALFASKHGGNSVTLPDSGRIAGNLPFFPHGYEDLFWNTAQYCELHGQLEDRDKLLENLRICTV